MKQIMKMVGIALLEISEIETMRFRGKLTTINMTIKSG